MKDTKLGRYYSVKKFIIITLHILVISIIPHSGDIDMFSKLLVTEVHFFLN